MRTSLSKTALSRGSRRRGASAAAIVAIALIVSACSSGDDGGDGDSNNGEGGGLSGDAITIALGEEPRTLASWNAYSNDGHPVIRNVEEALLNRDPDSGELVGELATSWEQVDDVTWRFELREGVTFHDDSPFTAEAAAFSLNHVLDRDNAFAIRTFLGPDVHAEAVDEYTLDVVSEEPDPILPSRLYFVTIPSMQALQENPDDWESHPVGTGPYKFVEWNRGQNIVLEANEDWWGQDAPEEAYGDNTDFSEVTYVFRPETQVRASLLSTGEAQFARWLNDAQCDEAPECVSAPGVETIILRLDTPNPALGDARVREAIGLSFDKSQIMNDIMGGGEVATQLVGEQAIGYADDQEPYPYDPERATQLIEEAAADGVPVDTPLVVAAREGYILRADESIQLIAESLRQIGLTNVSSEMRETAVFEEAWTAGYDAISPDRGLIGFQSHGNELLDYSQSVAGYYTCDGATSAYCDETLDQMHAEATQATGEERDQLLQEIAAYVRERSVVIPIGYPSFHFGMAEGLSWEPRMDGFILVKEMDKA